MRDLMYRAFTCCSRGPKLGAPEDEVAAEVSLSAYSLQSFKAHPQNVNGMRVLADRDQLVTCSDLIKVFSMGGGGGCSELASLEGHERDVRTIAACESLGLLFSASRDCSLVYWDISPSDPAQYRMRAKLANLHQLIITALAPNPALSALLSGSRDSTLRLLDIESQSCLHSVTTPRNLVTGIAWVGQSAQFVQTSEDKQLYLWDSRQMTQPAHVFPRKSWIQTHCHVSSDERLCVSSSNGFDGQGCEVSLWDLRAQKLQKEFRSHSQTVHACEFYPGSSSHFVSVSNDSTVNKWSVDAATPVDTKRPPTYSGLVSLAIGPAEQVFVGAVSGDVYSIKF